MQKGTNHVTPRMIDTIKRISRYTARFGYGPTIFELAKAANITDRSMRPTVHTMNAQGLVRSVEGKSVLREGGKGGGGSVAARRWLLTKKGEGWV